VAIRPFLQIITVVHFPIVVFNEFFPGIPVSYQRLGPPEPAPNHVPSPSIPASNHETPCLVARSFLHQCTSRHERRISDRYHAHRQQDKPLSFASKAGFSDRPERQVTDRLQRANDPDMKIIAIANQKGGTAKTTSTAALGILLSRRGIRVHLVDADPQANLSQAFGIADLNDRFSCSLLDGAELPIDEIAENLSITPGSVALATSETQLLTAPGREYFLRASLEKTRLLENAVVLVDSPPSLGILALNCLTAAGGLIVAVQPGGFELHALASLETSVRMIRERVNPDLNVLGILLTNCHPRRRITQQVSEEVAQLHSVLGSIRTDARLLYATTAGSILALRRSNAMDDYSAVIDRLEAEISW